MRWYCLVLMASVGCIPESGGGSGDGGLDGAVARVLVDSGEAVGPGEPGDPTEDPPPADDPSPAAAADPDDDQPPAPAPECGDGIDNDGDGRTDYPGDADCGAAGDTSEGPLCTPELPFVEVPPGGGQLVVQPADGQPVGFASCGAGVGRETVLRVRIADPSTITVRAASRPAGHDVLLYVRTRCDRPGSELACRAPGPSAELRLLARPAGEHFVFVQWAGDGVVGPIEVTVTIEGAATECNDGEDNDGDGQRDLADPGCQRFADPEEADPPGRAECADGRDNDADGRLDWPADEHCEAAGDLREGPLCASADAETLGAGSHVLRVEPAEREQGDYDGRCGGWGPEQVYALAIDRPSSLQALVVGGSTLLHLRSACDEPASELTCREVFRGDVMTVRRLEPGLYFLFVDSDFGAGATDIQLDIAAIPTPACADDRDNDGDGATDLDDPGCVDGDDVDEVDPPSAPACANGEDDDGDGDIDYPDDADCHGAGHDVEQTRCLHHLTVEVGQRGGVYEFAPPVRDLTRGTCSFAPMPEQVFALTLDAPSVVEVRLETVGGFADTSISLRALCNRPATERACGRSALAPVRLEPGTYYVFAELGDSRGGDPLGGRVTFDIESLVRECDDEVDNDGDGLVDAADPGCAFGRDPSEDDPDDLPACADGEDNDEDGETDWPDDPQCVAAGAPSEQARCEAVPDVVELVQVGGDIQVDTSLRPPTHSFSCADADPTPVEVVAITLRVSSSLSIRTIDADYDTALELRGDCDDAATVVACDDDSGRRGDFGDGFDGLLSRVEAPRLEAGTYYALVGGFAGERGRATLEVTVRALE